MGAKCCGMKKKKVKPAGIEENEENKEGDASTEQPEGAQPIPVSESKINANSNEEGEKVENQKVESTIGEENEENLTEGVASRQQSGLAGVSEMETVEESEEIIEESEQVEKTQEEADYDEMDPHIQQRSNVLEEIEDIENRGETEETEEKEEIYHEIVEEEVDESDQESSLIKEQSVRNVPSKTLSQKSDAKTLEFQPSQDQLQTSAVPSSGKRSSLKVPQDQDSTSAKSMSIIEIKGSSQQPQQAPSVIETPSFTGKRTSKVGPMPVVSQNYSDNDWPQNSKETPSNSTVGQQLQSAMEEKGTNDSSAGVTDQENPPSGSRVASGQQTPKKAKFFKDWGSPKDSNALLRDDSSSPESATDDSGCGSGKLFGAKRDCKIKKCPPNYNR